ncbi:hypothetical protein TIFTF001_015372 [Ficus carica]|uniref:Uncharacterized protein n=1 Tax=Ficus carica TaxID=3494 RepID=A0AA88AHM8_FICCA|nr:hypothetical protein TIFTF001_015372 [Ficus carica]
MLDLHHSGFTLPVGGVGRRRRVARDGREVAGLLILGMVKQNERSMATWAWGGRGVRQEAEVVRFQQWRGKGSDTGEVEQRRLLVVVL